MTVAAPLLLLWTLVCALWIGGTWADHSGLSEHLVLSGFIVALYGVGAACIVGLSRSAR